MQDNTNNNASQAGNEQAGPGKSASSDFAVAASALSAWGRPVVSQDNEFWTFSRKRGWAICTDKLCRMADGLRGRNTDNTVVPIMRRLTALPVGDAHETVYWEQTGDAWKPLHLEPSQVLFTDGILDVVTDEFTSTDGRVIFGPVITLPYALTEQEELGVNNELEQFVASRVRSAELDHFQEVLSCILQPHVPLRGQIALYGVPYSGKTTLATAIACVPNGRNGLSQVQEAELTRNQFSTMSLVGKFANVSDDSPISTKWVGFLKQYTSGNYTIEPKYGKPRSATPTAKLISTCNEIQSLVDASGAAADRLMLFKFDTPMQKRFGSSDDLKMTAIYWSEINRRQGGLSWLLAGLKRLRTRGQFAPPASWTRLQKEAREQADPAHSEIMELIEAGSAADFVATDDLLAALGWKRGDASKLRSYMAALFPKAELCHPMKDGIRKRGYAGVKMI